MSSNRQDVKSVITDKETEEFLGVLEERYGLSRSFAFRRGVKMLYEYLIENKVPEVKKQ